MEQIPFVFPVGSTISCLNFTIVDDSISENFEEIFLFTIGSIEPNNVDVQIGDPSVATITIQDDDGES